MTGFWLAAGAMIAVALALLLRPLLGRGARAGDSGRDRLNVELYRQRLAELERERDAGLIDHAAWEQARTELEATMAADLRVGTAATASRGGRLGAVLVLVLVPLVALGLYSQLGGLDVAERVRTAGGVAGPGGEGQMPSVEEMVARLEQRLQETPEDAQGWWMLGRSYAVMRRYEAAARAYERARQILGDDPDLLAAEAEVMALARGGDLSGEPSELIRRALAANPDHPRALWLAGFAAAQAGDRDGALDAWRHLLTLLPPGDEGVALVEAQIARVSGQQEAPSAAETATGAQGQTATGAQGQTAIGTQGQTATGAQDQEQATARARIRVRVSLAPELAARVQPTDTVFVFARAAQGPPMPLAAVRRTVADLPLEVELTDAMAMSPAARISAFAEVYVTARVSRSGTPGAQSGDLEGRSAPVPVGEDTRVQVVIDRTVP